VKPLILYWNELCIPVDFSVDEADAGGPWAIRAQNTFEALDRAFRLKSNARVSLTKGKLHAEFAGRSLHVWLEIWLGRDKLRRLKGRVIQPLEYQQEDFTSLECELYLADRIGDGLTRAHLASSWVWSFGNSSTASDREVIRARKISIDALDEVEISVSNIALDKHITYWEDALASWGGKISQNCVISQFTDFQIVMYPLDHGYPHVHVYLNDEPQRIIKYRIDNFEPLTKSNPDRIDSFMSNWMRSNSLSLLESWRRCQHGAHPLSIQAE
jgi:hypothetical protein